MYNFSSRQNLGASGGEKDARGILFTHGNVICGHSGSQQWPRAEIEGSSHGCKVDTASYIASTQGG